MVVVMSGPSTILRARLSADGRLLSADAALLALQKEAGGDLGTPIAVPQLAAIARLTHRMGAAVSRPVIAAAERGLIDMWVRARPDGGGVALAIIDWHERPIEGDSTETLRREADLAALAEGWAWQIDTELRFEMTAAGHGPQGVLPAAPPVPGSRFAGFFELRAEDDGDLPMLRGIAQRRAFRHQVAAQASDPGRLFQLSGYPLFDLAGQLIGYRGSAFPLDQMILAPLGREPEVTLYPADFGKRLDRSLRQPLGRIIANADTISAQMEGPLRADYAGYADDIASAGRHLMALIDDLADLQAIDRPDFSVTLEEVDLADLGRRAAGLLRVKALDRQILIVPPPEDASATATAEFRRVLQILVNLISNAVRYSPQGSMVRVVTEQARGQARIMVIDQGSGVAIADRERIFDKFERLGRDDAGGSGLGLYISRRLARAMGGDIEIGGAVGEGARFILSLPART